MTTSAARQLMKMTGPVDAGDIAPSRSESAVARRRHALYMT